MLCDFINDPAEENIIVLDFKIFYINPGSEESEDIIYRKPLECVIEESNYYVN